MISKKEIIIQKTDKSNKFAVLDEPTFLKLGGKCTAGDKEITVREAEKIATDLDAHTSAFLKMFKIGDTHNHRERIRKSFMGGHGISHLYLLLKDHKLLGKDGRRQDQWWQGTCHTARASLKCFPTLWNPSRKTEGRRMPA